MFPDEVPNRDHFETTPMLRLPASPRQQSVPQLQVFQVLVLQLPLLRLSAYSMPELHVVGAQQRLSRLPARSMRWPAGLLQVPRKWHEANPMPRAHCKHTLPCGWLR